MGGLDGRDELDRLIDAMRQRWLDADPGSDAAEEIVSGLTELLAERYQRRLEANDRAGVSEDLDEAISLLTTATACTPPDSERHAWLAWRAGVARDERWAMSGDPADLAAAIAHLSDARALPAEMLPDLHASLARLHAARADDREPGIEQNADLEAAVGYARSGLALLPRASDDEHSLADPGVAAQGTGTELRLILGLALAGQFDAERGRLEISTSGSVASARASRDEAIAVLTSAIGKIPGGEPAWVVAAGALGRARYDRYCDAWPGAAPPDPADLDQAIGLLMAAMTEEPEPRTTAYLVFALSDRLDLRHDPGELDRLITWCQRLLDFVEPGDPDGNFARELLSSALLDRADENPATRSADLDAAVGHLEAALAAAPAGDTDRASLLTTIAHACWQRLDGDGSRYEQVDQMTAYAGQAWALLSPDADDRALIGLYLATGTHERLLRPSEPFDVAAASQAIEVLTEIEPLLADDPQIHLTLVVTLGHFLIARGQATGATADVAAARPWLLQAAAKLPADDPRWSEIAQTLAVGMSTLASLGMDADHLDQAIALLAAASRRPHLDPARAAMTRGTLGMLLIQRASFTADHRDLDEGISHLASSHDMTPAEHAYRVATGVNLAGALLTRFLERGQAEDVDAARFYLTMAGALAGPAGDEVRSLMADVDLVIVGNKGLLGIVDGMRGDLAALDQGVINLETALERLPPSHPYGNRIRSDLGVALAFRGMSARSRPTDLEEASRQLGVAVATMADQHMMRPAALLRAGGTLAGAAAATGDGRLLEQAIGYLTRALGQLDPRFGGRFRFTALLGSAALALHELRGNPAELDSAITWLEESRRELSHRPAHPAHANCLINLARAYRARGDAGPARQAGFAALRVRARDLLLQSGTARSIHHARLAAAEATHVAAWCLEDRDAPAAVEALELGRGLILYASTSVTEIPDLLVAAGYPELAREWRDAAKTRRDTPWDAGIAGAEQIPGLLSGSIGLEMPDDLRARAFAALADSPEEQQLLLGPSAADLAAALAETGADALVYLVGPLGATPGRALIIPAPGLVTAEGPADIRLESLRDGADDALQAYASAYAAVLAPPGTATESQDAPDQHEPLAARSRAMERWRRALEDLCEWAWPTVMHPVLCLARAWGLGRPPRLVLIPTGYLSLVPWHAARWRPAESGPPRYALQEAVISYAASGRQLLEVAARPSLPLDASPVVIGDPTQTLPGALLEARAILSQCYPAGRYLGPGMAEWDQVADGPGTPREVLRQLPAASHASASMLHLGCHGVVADSAPGRSHLLLAGHQQLRVDVILRQASGRPAGAAGGLVSLAACGSDLALGDYDEALTLATAFLAAGAVTVVGARWRVPDRATSLLMFMFHYLMTRQAHSPRDALRGAQSWMLDAERKVPAGMPTELAEHATGSGLADLTAWAGVVHQGR